MMEFSALIKLKTTDGIISHGWEVFTVIFKAISKKGEKCLFYGSPNRRVGAMTLPP